MTRPLSWLTILVHVIASLPLALTAYEYVTGTLPIVLDRHLVIRFGALGLAFLVASFSITPISILSGKTNLITIRRPLGVYGFCYIVLHLLAYASLSNGFDWPLILRDLGERRTMSVGLLAFAYFAAPLSVLHYFWLERDIKDWVLIYAAFVAILFAIRLPAIRRALAHRRQRPQVIASENKDVG